MATSFDVVLVPLDHSTRAARSKSPVKLLEAVAAGAICIFSDAAPYDTVPDDCCLKASNTIEAWSEALETAFSMGVPERNAILERARALVVQKYTTEGQFYDFLAAYEAVRLHANLRGKAIAFAFHETALGGATLHLLQHAGIARSLGFEVVGIVPQKNFHLDEFTFRWNEMTKDAPLLAARWPLGYLNDINPGAVVERPAADEDNEAASVIASDLQKYNVGLLHFATWLPAMSALAKALGVPSVASVHQFYGGGGLSVTNFVDAIHCSSLAHGVRWEDAAKVPVRRIVCPAEEKYFRLFQANRQRVASASRPPRILVSGTLQQRKNQLAVIQAIGKLTRDGHKIVADVIGYTDFNPDYVARCQQVIEEYELGDSVKLHGFVEDPAPFYSCADLLVVAAFDESMPQTIIQAMAAGVPVVSTNVGGVKELVRHKYTGFLIAGQSPDEIAASIQEWLSLSAEQRLDMADRAQRVANFLARRSYVKFELVDLYNEALRRHKQKRRRAFQAAIASHSSIHDDTGRNCWQEMPAIEDLADVKDYTKKHFRIPFAAKIVPGADLREVPYREYVIPFEVDDLQVVSLLIAPCDRADVGIVGIEIVTRSQEIVAHEVLAIQSSRGESLAHFLLPNPVLGLAQGWCFRVFARDTSALISICEMSRPLAVLSGKRSNVPVVRFLSSRVLDDQN